MFLKYGIYFNFVLCFFGDNIISKSVNKGVFKGGVVGSDFELSEETLERLILDLPT
jgi:hypothetical protein